MKQKRRSIGGYKPPPTLAFTQDELALIQQGLALFAESLQRHTLPSPKLGLARRGYVTVYNKVVRLLSEAAPVSFNYNEMVVITTCLDMVLVDASFMADPVAFGSAAQVNAQVKQHIAQVRASQACK